MKKALENCRKQAVDVARVEDYVVGKAAINPFKSDSKLCFNFPHSLNRGLQTYSKLDLRADAAD
jgi:hypothetical protein